MNPKQIRPLALCVFRNGNRILVSEGHDSVRNEDYCRPLGGGIEFGETAAAAITREIREELGAEITALRLLGTLENIFTGEGEPGHEIVFVYDARFVDESLYSRETIPFQEEGWATHHARWLDLNFHTADQPLYPDGLASLLHSKLDVGR